MAFFSEMQIHDTEYIVVAAVEVLVFLCFEICVKLLQHFAVLLFLKVSKQT
jgi:hypothetical protein